ncbi:DUF3795 domain-containing protein [Clostridioides difficile]|nr:DUF3795 domain-containing protein [Clostridioides difficile]
MSNTCNGCAETKGHPFGSECMVALFLKEGKDDLCKFKKNLITAFNSLNIQYMEEVTELNALKGSFINIEYTLPKGQLVKFLDDNKIYFGNQLSKKDSDRYYGIIADEKYLMVSEYSGYGSDAEIAVFKRWM